MAAFVKNMGAWRVYTNMQSRYQMNNAAMLEFNSKCANPGGRRTQKQLKPEWRNTLQTWRQNKARFG